MLAVVIPFYKIDFFEETIQSLALQTNKSFNVYIGDDASNNPPNKLLKKYKDTLKLHYKRFNENLGQRSLTQQWERCLDMLGDEKWVMVVGDDDKLNPNCVSEFYNQKKEFEASGAFVLRFATKVINENSEVISKEHLHPKLERSIDFFIRKSKGNTRSSLSEYIFNRHELSQIGFRNQPLAWHSDDLAVLEVSHFSWIYTINEAFVYFRHSSENITGQKNNLKEKTKASFLYYFYLLWSKHAYFEKEEKEMFYALWEKSFLNIKTNIKFWMYFTLVYIRDRRIKKYVSFLYSAYNNYKHTNKKSLY